MPKNLYALANSVDDEESFLHFLDALACDWDEEKEIEAENPPSPYSPGALGWENGSISAFLDAASRWGKVSFNGLRFYEKPTNPWRRAAQILHAGKTHE